MQDSTAQSQPLLQGSSSPANLSGMGYLPEQRKVGLFCPSFSRREENKAAAVFTLCLKLSKKYKVGKGKQPFPSSSHFLIRFPVLPPLLGGS